MQLHERVQGVVDRLFAVPYGAGEEIAREAAQLIRELADRLLPPELEVSLHTNEATRFGKTARLSPNQAVVLAALNWAYPAIVSVPALHGALWGSLNPQRSVNTIRVMLTTMRPKLAALGVKIENQNGHGYRLELGPITSEVTNGDRRE